MSAVLEDQDIDVSPAEAKHKAALYVPKQGSGVKRFGKRRVRLTQQVKDAILIQLRRGSHLETAFAYARIPGSTYRSWIAQARDALSDAEKGARLSQRKTELIRFFAEVEEAQAVAEVRAVSNVHDAAMRGSWQAALAFLERRFPERWAKHEEHETNVNVTVGYQSIQVVASTRADSPPEPLSDNEPGDSTIPPALSPKLLNP
jgi:hypothetical protein